MYKLYKSPSGVDFVVNFANNTCIPFEPDNTDYQAYLKWVTEGNTPTPADEPTQGV